uniref:Uncharacterized protein n=1 Tax=Anguilla anguilla TaxID=7936 RepID=A0A0E9SVJ4_ANGAN
MFKYFQLQYIVIVPGFIGKVFDIWAYYALNFQNLF